MPALADVPAVGAALLIVAAVVAAAPAPAARGCEAGAAVPEPDLPAAAALDVIALAADIGCVLLGVVVVAGDVVSPCAPS